MAARSVWKGFVKFSLVTFPVKAYTATVTGGGGISLNQLHKECSTRIQYKKTCPNHGEVAASDIVSGYEFAPGQFVIIEPDEIDKLHTAGEKAISVAAIIDQDKIDPVYFSGKTYYLVPDGPIGQKPYSLLQQTLEQTHRFAFAQVVLHGKEQIVLLRPVNNMLVMSFLSFESEIKKLADFEGEAPRVDISPDEMKLAKTLTDTLAVDDFDLAEYRDKYTDNLTKLIEAKVSGNQITAPAEEEAPKVINLMEALKKSLEDAQKNAKPANKPPKLVAPSAAEVAAAPFKKKKA